LKVIQVIQKPQLRGAEIFSLQLSQHLINSANTCTVVSIFPGDANLPFSGEWIRLDRPQTSRFWDWEGWKQFSVIVGRLKPDVIQANSGDTLKFVVFSKIFFRWKARVIFRNANKISDFITSRPKYYFNSFLFRFVDHVVSVSTLCREDFIKTFNYPATQITTVPIGIDLREVGPFPADVHELRKKGSLLVNVASMVPEKNHKGLLRIFQQLLDRVPDVALIVIGKGKLLNDLESYARELGVSDRVFFLGARTDVLEILKEAKVFLLPSLIEGLPGVILEAQYCGAPVVANDVGGISEIVATGKTGWLVKRNHETEFVDAVSEILSSDGDKLQTVTATARRQVVEYFDNRVISARFLKLYHAVSTGSK
jgi:glycosyltransferase involved in cell wall biosynthesis